MGLLWAGSGVVAGHGAHSAVGSENRKPARLQWLRLPPAGKERKPHPGPSEKAGQGVVGAGLGPACLKVKSLPRAGGTQFIPPVGSSIRGSPTLPRTSDPLPHCAWVDSSQVLPPVKNLVCVHAQSLSYI